MAKSLRSKVKRSYRAKKRETGVYAAASAARLHRLHTKLAKVSMTDRASEDDEDLIDEEERIPVDGEEPETLGASSTVPPSGQAGSASMEIDSVAKRISTHGPRNSRREQWRTSKGLTARPQRKGMNKQGGVAARRKAGRPGRRR